MFILSGLFSIAVTTAPIEKNAFNCI